MFANRARVELERWRAEAVMTKACENLEVKLASAEQNLDLAYGELQARLGLNPSTLRSRLRKLGIRRSAAPVQLE